MKRAQLSPKSITRRIASAREPHDIVKWIHMHKHDGNPIKINPVEYKLMQNWMTRYTYMGSGPLHIAGHLLLPEDNMEVTVRELDAAVRRLRTKNPIAEPEEIEDLRLKEIYDVMRKTGKVPK